MAFGLDPGKLGFKLGDVLIGLRSGTTDTPEAVQTTDGKLHGQTYAWNPDTLAWEVDITRGAGTGREVFVTNFGGDETVKLDVASSTVTYVGKASPGAATSAAAWKVFRITTNAEGDLDLEYANSAATYANVWDNRASLTYGT